MDDIPEELEFYTRSIIPTSWKGVHLTTSLTQVARMTTLLTAVLCQRIQV